MRKFAPQAPWIAGLRDAYFIKEEVWEGSGRREGNRGGEERGGKGRVEGPLLLRILDMDIPATFIMMASRAEQCAAGVLLLSDYK